MSETRTVHDPFLGKDVEVSDRQVDRLRGKYACGPMMENGEPEFGWRDHETVPIQHEAAAETERLRAVLRTGDVAQCSPDLAMRDALAGLSDALDLYWNEGRTDGQVKNVCYWQFKAKEALALPSTPPASPPSPVAGEETDDQLDERLVKQEGRDNLRLLDYIAHKIGLPIDLELSRENFNSWLSSMSSTTRESLSLCSCKASERDGKHMMWCSAVARGSPSA